MSQEDADEDFDGGLVAALTRSSEGKPDGIADTDAEDDDFGFTEKKTKETFTDTLQGPSRQITEDDVKAGEEDDDAPPPAKKPAAKAPREDNPNDKPAGFDVFSHVKTKHGVDLSEKYKSPEDLVDGLVSAQRKLSERDEYAHWGRELATNPEAVAKFLLEKGYGRNPADQRDDRDNPKKPAEESKKSPALEWDDSWLDELDEKGQPRPDADKKILAKIRRWNEQSAEAGRNLVRTFGTNPQEAIDRIVAEKVAEALKSAPKPDDVKRLEQRLSQQDEYEATVAEGAALIEDVKPWAYVGGDQRNGKTPAGEVLSHFLAEASKPGPNGRPRFSTMADQMVWAKASTIIEMNKNPEKYAGKPSGAPKKEEPRLDRVPGKSRRQDDDDDEIPDSVVASGQFAKWLSKKYGDD